MFSQNTNIMQSQTFFSHTFINALSYRCKVSKQWKKMHSLLFLLFIVILCGVQRFEEFGANFHLKNVSIFYVSITSTDTTPRASLFQNQPLSWMESKKYNNEFVQCALFVFRKKKFLALPKFRLSGVILRPMSKQRYTLNFSVIHSFS